MRIAVGIAGPIEDETKEVKIIKRLAQHYDITIFSEGKGILSDSFQQKLKMPIIDDEEEAINYEEENDFDLLLILPLSGNSLSKLANSLMDNPVLQVAKGVMQHGHPIVLGIRTNDALGLNGNNLMKLMVTKQMFFVPFYQDDPINKPNRLIADLSKVTDTILYALKGKQLQPIILARGRDQT